MAQMPLPQGREDDETTPPAQEGAETTLPSGREDFILSPEARERLDARVAEAGGDLTVVEREIAAQLAELDSTPMPEEEGTERTQYQADRAFYVAQIGYLEKLANAKQR